MKNAIIENYEEFNSRRYGDPWVALVNDRGKLDFSKRVGAYTGGRGTGEAGQLYVYDAVEGQVYAYGQKDYRGHSGGYAYVQFKGGKFVEVPREQLLDTIMGE